MKRTWVKYESQEEAAMVVECQHGPRTEMFHSCQYCIDTFQIDSLLSLESPSQ